MADMAYEQTPTLGDILRHAARLLSPRRHVTLSDVMSAINLASDELEAGGQLHYGAKDVAFACAESRRNTVGANTYPRTTKEAVNLLRHAARLCDASNRAPTGIVVDIRA